MNITFFRRFINKILPFFILTLFLTACTQTSVPKPTGSKVVTTITVSDTTVAASDASSVQNTDTVSEDGEYQTKDEVALYIHLYEHLPSNYITKKEAQSLGWEASKGNLHDVAPGKSIGGDRFGNREGLLPESSNRKYYECDIDYEGGSRNAKRIVYSNDGLVFYTDDHYSSFEQIY